MLPVKNWLSMQEACSYLDMSKDTLMEIVAGGHLSVSMIGAKKYFRVIELNQLIEDSITIKKTT